MNDYAGENNNDDYKVNNGKTTASKFFEYKSKIIESTPADNNILDTDVDVPLKYLINFQRFLGLHLIDFEIEFDLSWRKDFIISEIFDTSEIDANPASNSHVAHARATSTTSALFQINSTKIYVPVVSLAVNNNIKFLENLKQGFKRTISQNKYTSERTTQ